jgi:glycosyltransferase involved in cell wall biosynthesis
MNSSRLKVLYFCDGFTDIRFVAGLSERCELTLATPAWEFQSSGLQNRIVDGGVRLTVDEIHGRRPAFQLNSFRYLLRSIRKFDVVLSQGMARGALNSTIAGRLMGVPVVTYESVAAVPYWRCRRERGEIGVLKTAAGELFLRTCMTVSGRLGTAAIGLGPYLTELVGRYSSQPVEGYYYGVDTALYRPVSGDRRRALRRTHDLPQDKFLILFSSRISHEKDPETALLAAARARARGLDLILLNLGGGFKDFLALALRLGLHDADQWVRGRPAVHPMKDLCEYFQTADLVIQASLEEGAGMSPLEALACGTPVVASNVGGLAAQLQGIAQLTPRRNSEAMADAILWTANNREAAVEQALEGRAYVEATWRADKAFGDLMTVLEDAASSKTTAGRHRPAPIAAS